MSNRPFRRLRRPAAIVAATAALALSAATLATPGAQAEPDDVLVDGLLAPLSLAVSGEDVYYASGGFAPGNPYTISHVGTEEPLVTSDKELGALSVDGEDLIHVQGKRIMRQPIAGGDATILANLGTYEKQMNPDGDVHYGFVKISQKCRTQWEKSKNLPPAKYTGIIESHPYATAVVEGTVYVADAAANAIFAIADGEVSVVKVLKPVRVEITKRMAKQLGTPDCAVGKTYRFEGVPTDVEVGPDGRLYVSSLPGGEIPGKGSVISVNTTTGGHRVEMTGLSGATGVAVDDNGDIYATNLFGPGISLNSPATPFDASVPLAAAVEIEGNTLYATVNVLPMGPSDPPDGRVVSYDLAPPLAD